MLRLPAKIRFRLLYAILATLVCGAFAARGELLPIKSYTSADGLIYESVNRVYQDSRGFIWFTTPVGISRFDGYQFTNYGMPEGLSNSLMTDMVEDSGGIYWFGTMGSVLYRFDPRALIGQAENPTAEPPKRFESFKISGSDYINRIYKTSNGAIYVAATNGLFLLDDTRAGDDKFVPVDLGTGVTKITVNWLAEDAAGSLWITTGSGLLRRLADGSIIRYEVLPTDGKDFLRAFTVDAKNQLWLVTENRHLIVFNPEPAGALNKTDKSLRKLRFSPENRLGANLAQGFAYRFTPEEAPFDGTFSMPTATRDGRIWLIALRKGLVSFDGREFRLFDKANGLSNNAPTALLEDTFGNLWIGSEWGAMKLSRKGFVTYNMDDGLGSEPISNIFSDRKGTLYASNVDWMINRFDGRKFTSVKLNIPETPDNWLSRKTLLDSAGDWWFATRSGLYRYSGIENLEQINGRQPTKIYKTEDGLPDNNIYGVFEDSRANVWVASAGARSDSITRWNREKNEFRVFSQADGVPENCYARHFREDAAGNLYFSCSAEFILIFQQEKFKVYTTPNLPKGWWIGDIHVDRNGRLWVASPTKGLLRIENLASGAATEKLYTTADGVSSIHIQFITEDNAGKIYFVTSRGMDVLEPESGKVKQYTLADGLAAAGTGVGLRDKNGDIWLGVSRGLSRFTPEADRAPVPPPVFIGAVRVAGNEYPISALGETDISGLTLEPDQSNIQIDFYGLNLTSGDALRYQYRLDGVDADWTTIDDLKQRSVNLSRSAGSYKFLVRAVTLEGTTSAAPASVSFTILRPVWQRWWFLLILTLLIVGVIYLIYGYRLRKLLELEKVRTRIATDLHDDIGASLSKIAILSEVVHQRVAPVAPGNADINEPLEEIAGTSRELVDSMSDIVWAINPERDHLSDLIQRMRNLAGELTEYAEIGLRVRLAGIEEGADLPLGADLRREIYLIFKETLNNLVRHSKCEMAEITFAVEQNFLVLTVKDDGKGFVAASNGNGTNGATRGGNGLQNMHRRAANLGGSYEIASDVGKGTTAVLRVPLQTGFGRGFGWKTLARKT
jgi:ligand-binding sensor domain-containing protein/two-component sensor histidine kinase